jgi:PAS domain S-box-containing protein
MYNSISKWEMEVILNSIYNGIIAINNKGIITIFNKAAEKILNIKAEDACGKYIKDIVPNTRLHIILKTRTAEIDQQQIVGNTTIITSRIPIIDGDGNLIGAVAIFRDISELKKLANELTNLREIESMLKAIINSTQDAISVVDEHGKGILVNPAYTRLTGLTEKDVIGKPATVDIAEGESMHMQVLRTGKPVWGVAMKVGPNKKEVVVNVAPIMVDGKLKGSVGVIHDISEIKRLNDELDKAKKLIRHLEAKYTFDDIIGESEIMQTIIEHAKKIADTPATVLLRGESGTGKELFAHAIHNQSKRRHNQFIRVNCAALSDPLLESELFGYIEGAFTGAKKGGKKGLFEQANGGTIFLDEIGEIKHNLQTKLLRVLQEKEIVRVGDTRTIEVDVRIIAATNVDLEEAVKSGKFREDLYYRLNVLPLYIPPLRKRKEDIPLLVEHLIRKYNQEYGRSVEKISEEALKILVEYNWPGNVRELENIISRAMINMKYVENVIQEKHLPILENNKYFLNDEFGEKSVLTDDNYVYKTLKEIIEDKEKEIIKHILKKTGGNKTEAAKKLGIAIRSLYYKLEKYEL